MSEIGDRPAEAFEWANGGSKLDPGAGKIDLGLVFGESPPYNVENWLKNLISQWITYTDQGKMRTFDNLGSAAELITTDQSALVNEFDPSQEPLVDNSLFGTLPTGGNIRLTVDGEYVFVGIDNNAYGLKRSDGSIVWGPIALFGGGNVSAMHSDGSALYVAAGQYLQKLGRTDGANDATFVKYSHGGGTINSVYSDSETVFVAASLFATFNAAAVHPLTAAIIFQVAVNTENGTGITSDGERVFFVTEGTGTNIYQLNRTSGASIGTAKTHGANLWGICHSEDGVYVCGDPNGSVVSFTKFNKFLVKIYDGDFHGATLIGGRLRSIKWDGKYIYIYGGDGSSTPPDEVAAQIRVVDPKTGMFIKSANPALTMGAFGGLDVDATGIFFAHAFSVSSVISKTQYVNSRIVRKISKGQFKKPFQQLMIPIED